MRQIHRWNVVLVEEVEPVLFHGLCVNEVVVLARTSAGGMYMKALRLVSFGR